LFEIDQIEAIAHRTGEIISARTGSIHNVIDKTKKLPEPNPIYDESVDMWQRILVHVTSKFPERLFNQKAPNETPAEWTYRKETYKSNTKQDWSKALHMVNRIWNPQNYSLKFNDDDRFFGDDTMKAYVLKDYPRGGNLLDYFKNIVTKNKDNDPNGLLCVKPLPTFLLDEDGQPIITEEGGFMFDDRELVKPVAYLYHSDVVMDFIPNQFALILSDEKSIVTEGTVKMKVGLVFDFYDDVAIYQVRQIGEKTDYKFEVVLYYKHDLGFLPAYKLMGVPIGRDDNEGYQLYKSPFFDAVDPLDVALYNYSTLQMSIVNNVYLERWEYVDECNAQGCIDGYLFEGEKQVACKSCNGTGGQSKASVLGVNQIKTKGAMINPDDAISPPSFGYVDKNPGILEFLEKNIDKTKKSAFTTLGMEITSQASSNETATARFIDRDEMFVFLMPEATQNFSLLNNVLWAIALMRYGTRYKGHELTTPTAFQMFTPDELTAEIARAREANLPDTYIAGLTRLIYDTRFSSLNTQSDKIIQVANYVDAVAYKTDEQINSALLNGTIAKWQSTLHTSFNAYLAQEIAEDSDFLDKELKDIKVILDAKAQAQQSAINPQQSGEDIIEAIVHNTLFNKLKF